MRTRPKVFFCSSVEGVDITRILAAHVEPDFEPCVWIDGYFTAGRYNVDELERAGSEHDFAVLCGTPDDLLVKRGEEAWALRDNIVFELGLFIGKLGRKRALLVAPRAFTMTLPTDIHGLVIVGYESQVCTMDAHDQLIALRSVAADLRRALTASAVEQRALESRVFKAKMGSARMNASRRLFEVTLLFRDLLIELPGDVIESFADPSKFNDMKATAATRVDKLALAFEDDATNAGVTAEFRDLAAATKDAVLRIPHPSDLLPSTEEIKNTATHHALQAVREFVADRSATEALRDAVGSDFEKRVFHVAEQYRAWWAHSERLLRRASDALHAALFRRAFDVAAPSLPSSTST